MRVRVGDAYRGIELPLPIANNIGHSVRHSDLLATAVVEGKKKEKGKERKYERTRNVS